MGDLFVEIKQYDLFYTIEDVAATLLKIFNNFFSTKISPLRGYWGSIKDRYSIDRDEMFEEY